MYVQAFDLIVIGSGPAGEKRGPIIGDVSGLVKLVFRADDQRLLGVHVLGELASELIHVGQACLHFGGGLDYFMQSFFNYPTLGEAYKYAAYDGLGSLERRPSGAVAYGSQ